MNPDKQPKTRFIYGCQACNSRFIVEVFGTNTHEPKMIELHKDCTGGGYSDLKDCKGYGVIIGVKP